MRKLLLTLAVLCGTVSGWAQGQTVTSITSGKWYQLKCTSTDNVHGNGTNVWLSDNGSAFAGKSATPTSFQFIATGNGKYHILSYKSNKYLGASGTSVVQEETATTEWTVGTINGEGYVYISSSDKNYLNNAGGTNNIQIKNHDSGVTSDNPCSLWYLTEEPESKYPFTVSSESEKHYYAIKSGRDTDEKTWWYTYTPSDGKIQLTQFVASDDQLWYFMEVTEGENTYIRLFPKNGNGMAMSYENTTGGGNKIVAKPIGTNGWTNTWEFVKSGGFAPYGLKTSTATMYLSNHGGVSNKMGMHSDAPINDSGTAMYIMTSAEARNEVVKPEVLTNAKNTAKAELDGLHSVATIYPTDPAEYKTRIDAVSFNGEGTDAEIIDSYLQSLAAVQGIVTEYRNVAYQALAGKMFSIKTPGRDNGYMEMTTSRMVGVSSLASPADVWQFVNNDGTVKVYNPYMDKYLAEPGGNSAVVGVTDAANAGSYHLNVTGNPANEEAKVKLTSNGKSVHMDGSFNLVRWDNGGASEWKIEEITNFSSIITTYKDNALATLNEWATLSLSVVFDAETIETTKNNINAITTTDWATFANIDAELKKVTDEVETKKFTFQTKATDANRAGVWVSANVSAGKAIGADNADLNAIWSLRHAAGTSSFYMYNLANNKYMGTPGGECVLADAESASYTFEIIDAANGVVELKSGGGTLHASNWGNDALINYDGDEAASRWTIASVSITDEQIAALVALNSAYNAKGFGNEIGLYSMTEEINAAVELLAKAPKDLETVTVDDINAKKDAVVAHTAINAPAIGKFYRLKNVTSSNYMSSTDTDAVVMLTDGAAAVSTIFYLDEENKMLSYNKGLFLDCGNKKMATVGTSYPGEFAVAHGGAVAGVVTYRNNGYWTFGNRGDGVSIDRGQDTPNEAGYNWTLEEVEWLPIPVNDAEGYTTIYSPVELELSEDRFKAYTVSNVSETYATLIERTVVPAGVGVVLKKQDGAEMESGCVYLRIKANETTGVTSELRGTYADEYIPKDAYVLSRVNGAVGFYKALMNQQDNNAFLNNGFKAYLPVSTSGARFLTFDFDDNAETGINAVEIEEAAPANAAIYDLSGRRVQNAKSGLYIINGKKVIK